jgi:Tfp pilus assembly ATPase PilU
MQTFDQSILELCQQEKVTIEEAIRWVTNVEEFKMRLRGITPGSAGSADAAAAPAPVAAISRFR